MIAISIILMAIVVEFVVTYSMLMIGNPRIICIYNPRVTNPAHRKEAGSRLCDRGKGRFGSHVMFKHN